MKSHYAWRPHLDRDSLYNPFAPSERTPTLGHVQLSEAYGDDVTNTETPEPTATEATAENDPEPPQPGG